MECFCCGGVAHPATGCQYSERVIICGSCTRSFWKWVRGHTSQSKRVGDRDRRPAVFVSFYEAAGRRFT